MKINLGLVIIILISTTNLSLSKERDSLDLKRDIEILKDEVERVKRDQLNYKIEKDLIKDTYGNNYEKISMVITVVLGLIGILGYLGLRDVNSIKKEYLTELDKLRILQSDFTAKANEFVGQKKIYDDEIKKLIDVNEEQNKKLKLLEIKEKVTKLLDDTKASAEILEYIAIGLEINPNDITLINAKSRACVRLNQIGVAIGTLNQGLKIHPAESSFVTNLVEAFFLNNQAKEARELLSNHIELFNQKEDKRLIDLFDVIEAYHLNDDNKLIETIKLKLPSDELEIKPEKLKGWNLAEVKFFLTHRPSEKRRYYCAKYIQYLDGLITGKELIEFLK